MLRAEGQAINRKRVQRLMGLMGIVALGPKPRTSRPAPGHKIYPYLLRDLVIDRANQAPRASPDARCVAVGASNLLANDGPSTSLTCRCSALLSGSRGVKKEHGG